MKERKKKDRKKSCVNILVLLSVILPLILLHNDFYFRNHKVAVRGEITVEAFYLIEDVFRYQGD